MLFPRQPIGDREGGLAVYQGDTGNELRLLPQQAERTYRRRACKIVMPFCIPRHTYYVTRSRENKKRIKGAARTRNIRTFTF